MVLLFVVFSVVVVVIALLLLWLVDVVGVVVGWLLLFRRYAATGLQNVILLMIWYCSTWFYVLLTNGQADHIWLVPTH